MSAREADGSVLRRHADGGAIVGEFVERRECRDLVAFGEGRVVFKWCCMGRCAHLSECNRSHLF